MKKILFIVPLLAIIFMASAMTGCRFAKSYEDGDTVAASVFEPEDTTIAAVKRRHAAAKAAAIVKDSADIYYVGDGSNRQFLQLVSYPSKRDTLVYGKTRHVKVKGSADFGRVVRVRFYLLNGTDSLVSGVEEVKQLGVRS